MSKKPRFNRQRSPGVVVVVWVCGCLSLGLVYLMGYAVSNDFGGFRSCSANNNGLTVMNCGKQSFNSGDVVLITLFILSALLAVSVFTAAWRMSRKPSE